MGIKDINKYWQLEEQRIKKYLENPKNTVFDYDPLKCYTYFKIWQLLFHIGLYKKFSVVEVGAGSGVGLSFMANYLKIAIGVEKSKEAVNLGNLIRNALKVGNLQFVVKDVFRMKKYQLPIIPEVSLSVGLLEHYDIRKQHNLIKKHLELSSRYSVILIPNDPAWSLFGLFLEDVESTNEINYPEKENYFNLEPVISEMPITIVVNDGLLCFTKRERLKKYPEWHLKLPELTLYPELLLDTISPKHLEQMAEIETGLPTALRKKLGFFRIYILKNSE